MKKSIMEKWVKALRSGEYKQGKDRLRSKDDKFCCLGVLCNLHAQEHPEIAKHETNPLTYLNHAGLPSSEVLEWAGFRYDNECGWISTIGTDLVTLNDTGKSFKQIANIIEKHYTEL